MSPLIPPMSDQNIVKLASPEQRNHSIAEIRPNLVINHQLCEEIII